MKMIVEALEGYELVIALALVALFVAVFAFNALEGDYKKRAQKKANMDADRLTERTEERDQARDDAFELREELKKAQQRIRQLEHENEQLKYDKKQLMKWEEK